MSVPVIAISNETTVLEDGQVQAVIPALQAQVSDDFKPYWNVDCTLTFLPKGQPLPAGWWQIVLIDSPDMAGALGYHELSSQGTPLGKVFAKLDLDHGLSWTVTLSHELLEMLADPWINWMAQGEDGKIYALEVSDAVEADELGYSIDGVLVSDFVTPGWFEQTENDRVDFKQRITKRLELAPGGYISVLDFKSGWKQIAAQQPILFVNHTINLDEVSMAPGRLMGVRGLDDAVFIPAQLPPIPEGSRRHRRTVDKLEWKRSTR